MIYTCANCKHCTRHKLLWVQCRVH